VHFCKVGKELLWDRQVLEVFKKLSANPPAASLTTDTLPVDVSWLKDPDEEEYDFLVHQHLEWDDLPERPTSEYQDLVDDAWSAMRSLVGDEDTPIPPQPPNVRDAPNCKNALDQIRNWCIEHDDIVDRDGPKFPYGFRLHGKVYEHFSNLPYRLLCCLWDDSKAKPKHAVPIDDALE
jgi:hypothetical protein